MSNMPLSVGIEEGARLLGISKHTLYSWIYAGRIRSVKLGSRRMIPYQELERIANEGLGDPEKAA